MVRISSCLPPAGSPVVVRAALVDLKLIAKPACSHWTMFDALLLGRRQQLISLLIDHFFPSGARFCGTGWSTTRTTRKSPPGTWAGR